MKRIIKITIIFLLVISFFVIQANAEQVSHVVISEIKITGGSGKSTDEFIELYNPADQDVILLGWQLIKKTASGNEYVLVDYFDEREIKAHSFFLVAHPAGYTGEVQADFYYTSTNSMASNNAVLLLNELGEVVDKVGFGTASDFEGEALSNPGSNKSTERKALKDSTAETMVEGGLHYFLGNGEDSDNNIQDFIIRSAPEPQNTLSEPEFFDIEIPEISEPSSEEGDTPPVNISYSEKIVISELFPNPEGRDDDEFIELFNSGSQAIDLTDWQLGDNSSRRYTIRKEDFLTTIIKSGGYFIVEKSISGISLNNTSDAAYLYWPNGTQVDYIEYSDCQEAQSYSLVKGAWVWTDKYTPGSENKFEVNNKLPIAILEASEEDVKVEQVVHFDASRSEDLDGDELEYFWSFGDGQQTEGEKVEHIFQQPGKFVVILLVKDVKGGEDETEIEIIVTDYDYSEQIIINELLPACSPTDRDCEFIELFNQENREVNLEGWQLTDLKKYYKFPEDSGIKSGSYLVVERQVSKITLNNNGDTVFLLDPSGRIINGVEYKEAKKDISFSRDIVNRKWHWTEKPTPGKKNEIVEEEEEELEELEGREPIRQEDQKKEDNTVPIEVSIKDVTEDMLGSLLKITGEVESAKSTGIYLMDDLGNVLRVYIQKKTGIPKPDVKPGDSMSVVGMLDKTKAGLRLLPRTEEDIVIMPKLEEKQSGKVLGAATEKEVVDFPISDKSKQAKIYLFVTAGVLLIVMSGLVVKWYLKNKKGQKSI